MGSQHQLVARNIDDAKRMLKIIEKRGLSAAVGNVTHVQQKVPPVHRPMSFDGPKVWRSVAKAAAVGVVVLFGNEKARALVDAGLRAAIRYGTPDVADFAGWDFINAWPTIVSVDPHPKTPTATCSGFEHSVIMADVNGYSVGYIALFGKFRFSARLGRATNLPPRGLALNPRSTKPARFSVKAIAPETYIPRHVGSFKAEHANTLRGVEAAFEFALSRWSEEARAEHANDLANELLSALADAGQNEAARAAALRHFVERIATVEHGAALMTELEESLIDDE